MRGQHVLRHRTTEMAIMTATTRMAVVVREDAVNPLQNACFFFFCTDVDVPRVRPNGSQKTRLLKMRSRGNSCQLQGSQHAEKQKHQESVPRFVAKFGSGRRTWTHKNGTRFHVIASHTENCMEQLKTAQKLHARLTTKPNIEFSCDSLA